MRHIALTLSGLIGAFAIPTAATAETVDWSGWYASAFAGYADAKLLSDAGHSSTTTILDDNGFMTGVAVGYRKQSESNIVIGGELIIPLYMEKGRAVDHVYFPGQVFYEAKGKFGIMASGHVGIATGNMLPYVFGAAGIARVEGRTLNIDPSENLVIGYVQKAKATPFMWQLGAGVDVQASPHIVIGARTALFRIERADYTMPWNNDGNPNQFGMSSAYGQLSLTYRFGH